MSITANLPAVVEKTLAAYSDIHILVNNAALFLASAASDYMTGSTVVVDGGLLVM